jgi:enoyl-CoA hydratase/carnithine racemase
MPTVLLDVKDKIAFLTLNRPDRLNAINTDMLSELWQAMDEINYNPDIWVAVLTGAGRAFSTGHDLGNLAAPARGDTDALYVYQQTIWKPMIAAVNGLCLAQGAGIALSCDIRFASTEAKFGWPQAKRGISSVSGPTILPDHVPFSVALEWLFTGDSISAETALKYNLVSHVVAPEDLMTAATDLAERIRANAPLSVRSMKETARRAREMKLADRVRFALMMMALLNTTEDAQEGIRAFMEKRPPKWTGKVM